MVEWSGHTQSSNNLCSYNYSVFRKNHVICSPKYILFKSIRSSPLKKTIGLDKKNEKGFVFNFSAKISYMLQDLFSQNIFFSNGLEITPWNKTLGVDKIDAKGNFFLLFSEEVVFTSRKKYHFLYPK